jgi:uncharacterized protein (TIGR03083 family)
VDFAAEFLEQNRLFGDLILAADPDTPVSTCPGWTVTQLLRHVGRGNRWAAQIISDRVDDGLDFAAVRDGRPPADSDGTRQWLLDGGELLVDAAAAAGADTPVWTFTGPQPATWWVRRRLHEVAVHRADAAIAVGAEFEAAPELAADALSEWFDLVVGRMPDLAGRTVHLHATDDGLGHAGEWTIIDDSWTHSHGKGDVALRGPAIDLLTVTTRRRPVGDTAVEVFGDAELLATWLDGMKF